jgi:hypothetical protein
VGDSYIIVSASLEAPSQSIGEESRIDGTVYVGNKEKVEWNKEIEYGRVVTIGRRA